MPAKELTKACRENRAFGHTQMVPAHLGDDGKLGEEIAGIEARENDN